MLELDRALHGIDGAAKLDQHAVAGSFEDAALMFGDQWVQNVSAPGLESGHGACLVGLHHPAKANHIGGKDGGKTALYAFFSHAIR